MLCYGILDIRAYVENSTFERKTVGRYGKGRKTGVGEGAFLCCAVAVFIRINILQQHFLGSNYRYYIGDEHLPPPQITVARKRESGPAILVVTGKSDFLVRRTRRKGGSTRNYLEH
ncbi:hypothetical protein NDU88_000517 [Pleurodeles waltl]|uniref:Uncharacterized protein n=1 Tax=Pleurodeles waltl TaxID=8319 RepID=A0AAV7U4K5_PLEWA|nr:hypothetical protein NDU88_000517 [Pleurodeles waltl]